MNRSTPDLHDPQRAQPAVPVGSDNPPAVTIPEALVARLPEALRAAAVMEGGAAPPSLLPYPPLPKEHFRTREVTGRLMAYASPDSTYAVTRRLVDSARRSLVIGIYDFSAGYMKEHLKKAMKRGVKLSLMLDTNKADDPTLFGELTQLGATCVRAPSVSAGNPIRYFENAHEKIIVVDGEIVMIQSGNWSENGIPYNEGDGEPDGALVLGNREMGIAVESAELAALFADLITRDMRLAQGEAPAAGAPNAVAESPGASAVFFEAAPQEAPVKLFPSLTVKPTAPVRITPVVTPENFHDAAKEFLRSARRSIRIEQQYIKGKQPAIQALLEEIRRAREASPGLDVRIIVSPKYLKPHEVKDFAEAMASVGLELGTHFRYLSLRHFVHCHNKLVVVDGEQVLLGSQNWSTVGVLTNREASLLVEHPGVASYFAEIFDADWEMSDPAASPPEALFAAALEGLADAADFANGGIVQSSVRDYADV